MQYGPDPSQFFDLYLPVHPEHRASAVMIHGGFWRSMRDLSNASHLCAALAQHGVTTANLEYRRTGLTGGGWPATFDDVVCGFHAVRQQVPSGAPVVLGHSAGGHLALRLAAATDDIAGVVALGPVTDLDLAYRENLGDGAVSEFLGGGPDAIPRVYEAADPARHSSTVPRTLIYGTEDDIVPVSFGRAFLHARKDDAGAIKLIEIPGADHFDVIDPESDAFARVLASVLEYLEG